MTEEIQELRKEFIEELQNQVQHNRITAEKLGTECELRGIELHEEILAPIGYNTCDRCGEYGDSELDFLCVDSFEWDESDNGDHAVLNGIDIEGIDYCVLCWGCVNELRKKGREGKNEKDTDA